MVKKYLGKKAIVTLLTMSMIASMGACGKKDNDKSASSNGTEAKKEEATEAPKEEATEAPKEEAKASGQKTKITWYRDCFNVPTPDEDQVKAVEKAINEYIDGKIDVEVELHDISSAEYGDKINLAIVGGEADLFFEANWLPVINCDDLVKQNAAYDITELIKDTPLYTSMPDWVWGSSAYDGKNYFVPCYKESAEGYDLAFRKDLVDKYGWDLSTVKTLKDIEPMLADMAKDGIKYPYLTQKTAMFYRYYMDKYDFVTTNSFIAVSQDEDKVVNTVQTPEFKEFCTLMADWAEKGYLHEDDLTKTTNDTTTQGKDWGITWWTDVPNNGEASTRWKQDIVTIPLTQKWLRSTGTTGSCYAISSQATPEKAKAAVDLLGLLYTDKDFADLCAFGIEGVNYTREDNGKVTKVADTGYNHSAWETTTVTNLSLTSDEPDDKIDLYKKFNDTANDSKADGFRFNVVPVETESSALKSVFDEFGFGLEHGGYAVSDVEQGIKDYQDALDNAGYQKYFDEVNSQYETWKQTR